jgi:1-acyl-sn-glycerol-3-phosphate acyltransferase
VIEPLEFASVAWSVDPDNIEFQSWSTTPATTMSSLFVATWRAFAVAFFSSCALAESAMTMPFIPRARRLQARARWLHRWSSFASRVIGIHPTMNGSMPRSGLLVSNHLSYIDIIVFSSITPCIFVAKRDVAGWPFFGWLARAAGTIFVDRNLRRDAVRALVQMENAIRNGGLVVLFPEATSSDGSSVLPFKPALLEPVRQLACPIAAAAIDYSLPRGGSVADEVCYWRDTTFLPHLLHLFSKPEIHAKVSIAPFNSRGGSRKEIAQQLRGEVMAMRSQ